MRKLSFPVYILLFLLAVTLLESCKKQDRAFQETKSIKATEQRFFQQHTSSDPKINAVMNYVKRQNDKKGFVEKTVQRIGFPYWDKAMVFQVSSRIQKSEIGAAAQRTTNTSSNDTTTIIYIPFVREGQNYVNSIMVLNAQTSDTSFKYLCAWQYADTAATRMEADALALLMMKMDQRVFGNKQFSIKDPRLFGGSMADKQHTITLIEKPVNGDVANSYYTYVEICYLDSAFGPCTGQVSGCPPGDPNCNPYCWTVKEKCNTIAVFVMTEPGTGGSGSNPNDDPGDTGADCPGGCPGSGGDNPLPPSLPPCDPNAPPPVYEPAYPGGPIPAPTCEYIPWGPLTNNELLANFFLSLTQLQKDFWNDPSNNNFNAAFVQYLLDNGFSTEAKDYVKWLIDSIINNPGSPFVSLSITPPVNQNPLDLNDYLKCFDNTPGSTYKVTISADQPIPGQSDCYKNNNGNIDVGHTFLTFEQVKSDGSTIKRSFGFYPSSGVKPLSPNSPGVFLNDENHISDASLTSTITDGTLFMEKINTLRGMQSSYSNINYNLSTFNCTTFATAVINSFGESIPYGACFWALHGNPGDLGQYIRNMQLKPNQTRNLTTITAPSNLTSC